MLLANVDHFWRGYAKASPKVRKRKPASKFAISELLQCKVIKGTHDVLSSKAIAAGGLDPIVHDHWLARVPNW